MSNKEFEDRRETKMKREKHLSHIHRLISQRSNSKYNTKKTLNCQSYCVSFTCHQDGSTWRIIVKAPLNPCNTIWNKSERWIKVLNSKKKDFLTSLILDMKKKTLTN